MKGGPGAHAWPTRDRSAAARGRGGGVTTGRVRSDGTVRRRTPKDASTTDTRHHSPQSRALVPDPRRPARPPPRRVRLSPGVSPARS